MAPSDDSGGSPGQEPAEPSLREAFRTWRRSRPFWGGLLLILAGLEMLAIPLLSVLAHTSVKVVIYIGIGGIFGVLIGGLLIACGLLVWFHPVQRVFYAIAGVLLAVASFVATNLGGFFIGMLLGVTGGSLSFGWTPGAGRERSAGPGRPSRPPQADEPSDGLGIVLRGDTRPGDHRRSGGRLMALAITPVIVSGLMLPGYVSGAMRPAASMRPAAPAGCIIPIPIICPPPSPSPTSSATPTPTTGSSASPGPIPLPVPTGAGPPGSSASGSAQSTRSPGGSAPARARAAAAPAQMASAAQSSLTADSAFLYGLSYDGPAQVATASGTVTMMKFTLSSLTLSGHIALTVGQGGTTAVTQSSSMQFGGPVTLYATRLSGRLLGVPVTLTPNSPIALILQAVARITQVLTQAVPVPMTNVVTDQPYTTAGSFQAAGLQIGT